MECMAAEQAQLWQTKAFFCGSEKGAGKNKVRELKEKQRHANKVTHNNSGTKGRQVN